MNGLNNRSENRLRYSWPVWFAENFDDMLAQGQMVDVSSKGAAFTCYADKCPHPGQHITTRFSVPRHHSSDPFDLESFVRSGHICRVEDDGPHVKRIAIQFSEPLPFNPGDPEKIDISLAEKTRESIQAISAIDELEAMRI
jgi:hypothetical protein